MGALSVTGTEQYRKPFEPLVEGVKFADYNDLESVKALLSDKTCAIILETVQGEGGIYPAETSFWKGFERFATSRIFCLSLMRFSAVWEEPDLCLHGRDTESNQIL